MPRSPASPCTLDVLVQLVIMWAAWPVLLQACAVSSLGRCAGALTPALPRPAPCPATRQEAISKLVHRVLDGTTYPYTGSAGRSRPHRALPWACWAALRSACGGCGATHLVLHIGVQQLRHQVGATLAQELVEVPAAAWWLGALAPVRLAGWCSDRAQAQLPRCGVRNCWRKATGTTQQPLRLTGAPCPSSARAAGRTGDSRLLTIVSVRHCAHAQQEGRRTSPLRWWNHIGLP